MQILGVAEAKEGEGEAGEVMGAVAEVADTRSCLSQLRNISITHVTQTCRARLHAGYCFKFMS